MCIRDRVWGDGDQKVIGSDMRVPELGRGGGAGLPLRLHLTTQQCSMEAIAALKSVLLDHPGDTEVYLTLSHGEAEEVLVLGDHLTVDRSNSLMGDLKATMGPGIVMAQT